MWYQVPGTGMKLIISRRELQYEYVHGINSVDENLFPSCQKEGTDTNIYKTESVQKRRHVYISHHGI